ncbi:MAG: hypothetical protein WAO19_01020 [Candidatus Kryptoniota bacterium]
MARKRYFPLMIVLTIGLTVPSGAQVLKNGICPTDNSSAISHQLSDIGQGDEINPFANHSISSLPQYSPALLSATSVGAGAVGTLPISGDYILRISLLSIYPSMLSPFNSTSLSSQGVLMPIEFGVRVPFINSTLGALGYTLYGETSAGLLLGMVFPTGGSFLSYSIPNSRFSTGASAYIGIGNTLRMDKFVGLYLNGGMGYFDLFSSSFMPRTSYFVPSVSIGLYFNMGQ